MNENRIKVENDKMTLGVSVELKNSLIFSLLFNKDSKSHLKSEIKRINNDIKLIESFKLLYCDLDVVIGLIRQSNIESEIVFNLVSKYKVTEFHARSFIGMEISELSKINLNEILIKLIKIEDFYKGLDDSE